jgi:NTE family protein
MTTADQDLAADVVLAGGGVKGIGLVGALAALLTAGYHRKRISGTSAGAMVGSIAAAGASSTELKEIALSLDYLKCLDPAPIDRIPLAGRLIALLRGTGIYRGDYIHDWLRSQLADLGVHTFSDLKIDDDSLPPERRYGLVIRQLSYPLCLSGRVSSSPARSRRRAAFSITSRGSDVFFSSPKGVM